MNGAHDMGGMMEFGPILPEPNEPTFHAQWERRAMALTLAMAAAGGWDLDKVRAARERLPPAEYLAKSYYQIWISALESMMIERGLVGADEIAAGKSLRPGKPVKRVLAADSVAPSLARGAPVNRDVAAPPRFAVGQRVRARNMHPAGHTRLPRYARGHVGVITHIHGAHVLPDSNSTGAGENPEWLYTVRFSASELWGDSGDVSSSVSVDAWESYLRSERDE